MNLTPSRREEGARESQDGCEMSSPGKSKVVKIENMINRRIKRVVDKHSKNRVVELAIKIN